MRDMNRIYPICNKMAALWAKIPDWRFMQLICNFMRESGYDPFYMEDDKFIDLFENYVNGVVGE